jgi:hypothetical protein
VLPNTAAFELDIARTPMFDVDFPDTPVPRTDVPLTPVSNDPLVERSWPKTPD